MKTTHKIAAARAIYHVIHAGRMLLGRTDHEIVAGAASPTISTFPKVSISQSFSVTSMSARQRPRYVKWFLLALWCSILELILERTPFTWPNSLEQTGYVMAFEPTDFAFSKLSRNLDLNPLLAIA